MKALRTAVIVIATLAGGVTFNRWLILHNDNAGLAERIRIARENRQINIDESEITDSSLYEVAEQSTRTISADKPVLYLVLCDLTIASCRNALNSWSTLLSQFTATDRLSAWCVAWHVADLDQLRLAARTWQVPYRLLTVRDKELFARRSGLMFAPTVLFFDRPFHVAAIVKGQPAERALTTVSQIVGDSARHNDETLLLASEPLVRLDLPVPTTRAVE
jgi:hypothetical protein